MRGHYIEVDGPVSETEIVEVLERLIAPECVQRTAHCPPLLTLKGGRTIVFIDVSVRNDGPVLLAVGDLDHDDVARQQAAELICRTLAAQTSWQMWCSTDDADSPGMRWAC